jgi:hypothetical protein
MLIIKEKFGANFKVIRSRDGKQKGKFTGATRYCKLDGCYGLCFATKWADGKMTWPCSKGIGSDKKGLKIL